MTNIIMHFNSTAHSVRSFTTLYFDIVRGRVSHNYESVRLVLSFNDVVYIFNVRGGFSTSLSPRGKFHVVFILDVKRGFPNESSASCER